MIATYITDTRMAASALGLGFAGSLHSTVHTQTGKPQYEVRFETPSARFPHLELRHCIAHWRDSGMLKPLYVNQHLTLPAEPLHAFACAMRAQVAYDAYLHAQKTGGIPHLVACAEGWAFEYDQRIELDTQVICETVELTDLALCAALAPLGIPLLGIKGSDRQRSYTLARNGFAVKAADGVTTSCDALHLTRRAPTAQDPLHLALEDEQPMHPVCIGYDALTARRELKRQIGFSQASLIVTDPQGTARQALIPVNYKSHVGDAVARHFKAPPSSLGL